MFDGDINLLESQDIFAFQNCDTHKASFRSDIFPLHEEKTNVFENKKALLFVSVGQAYHEKGKLLATINLINKYPFLSCDVVMADTLQRYNFIAEMGADRAHSHARQMGDAWLSRNATALSQLKLPHDIIRWDDLLSHSWYAPLREKIDSAYIFNDSYRYALHGNAESYIDRMSVLNPKTDKAVLLECGLKYLIEELPIVMPMWAQQGYDFIIYPKPMTPGMQKTYELFVKNIFPGKCQWVYMRFKKK